MSKVNRRPSKSHLLHTYDIPCKLDLGSRTDLKRSVNCIDCNEKRCPMSSSKVFSFQLKKLQDRVSKCKDEVSKCREKYQVSLQDINNYNAKYMEEMTNVFEECQRREAQRLQEFKDILFAVQKCLNVSEDPE